MQTKKTTLLFSFILMGLLTGCTTIQVTDPRDPWEGWNRTVQTFNDELDDIAFKPMAKAYRWITPGFVDRAITNVFSNTTDIGVALNDMLQGKVTQSGMDFTRFVINTSFGLGGLIDVAAMINLPKHKEDFGQTLGYWGVPTGPYIVLPLYGPSSPRGIVGLVGDSAMNPVSYISLVASSYISPGLFVLNTVDKRADNLATEKIADEAAVLGRYEFFRDAYIANREYLVLDGNVPEDEEYLLDEDFEDDLLEDEESPDKNFYVPDENLNTEPRSD
ncbi:MAG: VacJ family lipoprotein [Methylococcales bacterium]|nr:VacJ family lipoprotein [Methylococcales bacterium]